MKEHYGLKVPQVALEEAIWVQDRRLSSYYYTADKSKNDKNTYDNEDQALPRAGGIEGIQKTSPVISCNAVNNPIYSN